MLEPREGLTLKGVRDQRFCRADLQIVEMGGERFPAGTGPPPLPSFPWFLDLFASGGREGAPHVTPWVGVCTGRLRDRS